MIEAHILTQVDPDLLAVKLKGCMVLGEEIFFFLFS
jgi:hypothetical protein